MDAISTVKVGSKSVAWPGAYSQSDTSAAQVAPLLSRGTVALVGPAICGKPGVVHDFVNLDQLRQMFWLSEADGVLGPRLAAQYLYGASADPNITGGPTRVLVVKTNQDTTGTAQLQGPLGALIDLTSKDFGAHVNGIRVSVSPGKSGGVGLLIKEGSRVESGDSIGATKAMDLKFTGLSTLTTVKVTVAADFLTVAWTGTGLAGQSGGEVATNWGGGAAQVATVVSNNVNDIYQKITIYGLTAGNVVASELLALNGTTPVNGAVAFTKVTGARIDGLTVGTVLVKDQVVATSMSFAPTLLAAMDPGVMKVVSDNALDKLLPVAITGYDANNSLVTETLVLNGTTVVTGATSISKLLKVAVTGVTAGTVAVKDHNSLALLSIAPATNPAPGYANALGLTAQNTLPQAGPITFTGAGGTFYLVIRGTNTAGAAATEYLTAAAGVATPTITSWALVTQIETGATAVAVTMALSGTVAKIAAATTVGDAVATLKNTGVFVANSYNDTRLLSGLDLVSAVNCKSPTEAGLFSKTADVVDWINANSALVAAARIGGASGLPIVTAVPVAVVGGTTVATTVADYEAALELLKDWPEVNAFWVNSSDDAVRALAAAHCDWAAEVAERFAFLALPSNATIDEIDSATIALGNQNVVLCAQNDQDFDEAGTLRTWAPLAQAVKALGMFISSVVGEPLTRKYVATRGQSNSKWTPLRDGEALLRRGLLFSVYVKGKGTRWVRGITTYRRAYNTVYTEISAMDSFNSSKRDIREFLDELVTGADTVSLPIDAIRRDAEGRLLLQRDGGMITNFANALAAEQGDLVTFDYDCGPRQPRNFTLIRAHVAVATQKSPQS